MPTPIDPKKLPGLRAQLKRFKDGDKLPQQELAKLYGVTNARLTTLIHQRFENFPPAERHGDKTHWYEVLPALRSMIAYLDGRTKHRSRSAAVAARLMGTPVPPVAPDIVESTPEDEAPPLPTPADLDKIATAAIKVFRLQQDKRQFVHVSNVQHLIRGLFALTQRTVTGLPAEIDPNGELPPLVRESLERAVRDALVKHHAAVRDWLEPDEADLAA